MTQFYDFFDVIKFMIFPPQDLYNLDSWHLDSV